MTKLIFFGTPDYVLPVLEKLHQSGFKVAAVVTQPPKPVGRKQILTPSAVAWWAKEHDISVFDKSPKELVEPLKNLGAEVGVLAAYGRIFPEEILDIFPKGIVNIHPSLLPKYRGASPVEAAIASQDKETGYTIMLLEEDVDAGSILYQAKEKILDDDTKVSLRNMLFLKSATQLPKVLNEYLENMIEPKEQDHEKATYTTLIEKEYGLIPPKYIQAALQGVTLQDQWIIPFIKNFSQKPSPSAVEHFIHALYPWPGAHTPVRLTALEGQTKKLKIIKAHLENEKLVLDQVQLEGKNPVSWKQFCQGYPKARFE